MSTNVPSKGVVRLANIHNGPLSMQVGEGTELENKLKNVVLGYWPERKNDFFPAPQPVSLERRDLYKLKNYPYLVCVKSDGMRFLMLLVNSFGTNKCYLVDRAFRFYAVDQPFGEDIYNNTVFDGELVRTETMFGEKQWSYIIHDCVCYKNINVAKKTFKERYACVESAVTTDYTQEEELSSDGFNVQIKKFFPFRELDQLVKMMEDGELINHNTDGIIITPSDLPIGMYTQYTLFKWKPRQLHTFDFKIEVRNGTIYAQVNDKKNSKDPKNPVVDFASVSINTENGKLFFDRLKAIEGFKNGSIVECDYDDVTECYKPKLIRNDKKHPNGLYTVEKTLNNIVENITIEHLQDISRKVTIIAVPNILRTQ